jgi:hypothetical protein
LLSIDAPLGTLITLIAYPAYLILMAAALAICGVPRKEIAKWALRQAGRQRLTDLIRAARGVPDMPIEQHDRDSPSV